VNYYYLSHYKRRKKHFICIKQRIVVQWKNQRTTTNLKQKVLFTRSISSSLGNVVIGSGFCVEEGLLLSPLLMRFTGFEVLKVVAQHLLQTTTSYELPSIGCSSAEKITGALLLPAT